MIYVTYLFFMFLMYLIPISQSHMIFKIFEVSIIIWLCRCMLKSTNLNIDKPLIFGILSILIGLLVPFMGIILGIVVLIIKKIKKQKTLCIILGWSGISISIISWIVAFFMHI
ncbi:MAG: hypothetical protein KAQ83_01890 [Nanoarchaeota archaeon]|nr:hypothetical protein [Nanoarchaeota archaeon]